MEITYSVTKVFDNIIDIENIGDCCVRCRNADGDAWVIAVQSDNGFATVLAFGPVMEDNPDIIHVDFKMSITKSKFNIKKLQKTISQFINQPMAKIISAEEINMSGGIALIPHVNVEFAEQMLEVKGR